MVRNYPLTKRRNKRTNYMASSSSYGDTRWTNKIIVAKDDLNKMANELIIFFNIETI
jgi:hypothetical protein